MTPAEQSILQTHGWTVQSSELDERLRLTHSSGSSVSGDAAESILSAVLAAAAAGARIPILNPETPICVKHRDELIKV